MTNEEAIHIIDVAFGVPQAVRRFGEDRTYHEAEIREAKDMAIKALSCSENPSYNSIKTELDAISKQAVLEQINCWIGSGEYRYTNATDYLTKRITSLLSVSAEKTDAYKQGWHDAITTALKETHSVHTEEGHFRVVQEETLIGVGMAYEQVSMEKTGRWIMPVQDDGMSDPIYYQVRCSECGFDLDPQTWHQELHQYGADKYCPKCGTFLGGDNNGYE